jgi:hypothetical protein
MITRGLYGSSSLVKLKEKREKLRCLLLRRKKENIFFICMKSLLHRKKKNAPPITTERERERESLSERAIRPN